jgi:hypothetical protein
MVIRKRCKSRCEVGPTPAGIALVRQALAVLGHPAIVDYVDVADAITPRIENAPYLDVHGVAIRTDGHHKYLALGTDITCDCVLTAVLARCGYVESDLQCGKYVREIQDVSDDLWILP